MNHPTSPIPHILHFFKKLLWLVLAVFVICNIALFYFLNGVVYFIVLIIGNIVLFWLMIPVVVWVGKTFLIDKGLEVVEEVKENFEKIDEGKIVKVVKKDSI